VSEILDYLAEKLWYPTSKTDDTATGCCMFHNDHNPSLMIGINRTRGEYFRCQASQCAATGTLERLVLFYEFRDNPRCWPEVFEWTKAWRGNSAIPSSSSSSPSLLLPRQTMYASWQQRMLLTTFMKWAHVYLHSPTGDAARAYLCERGLGLVSLHHLGTGYVPTSGSSFQYLVARMREVDPDWRKLACSLGILTKAGGLRLAGRVIFFVQDAFEQAIYYQARVIGETKSKARKWLNPPVIARVPFQMPVPRTGYPHIAGTLVVENALVAALLAETFHASVISTGGSGCHIDLSQYEEPFWLCQDQDEAGEKQAYELAVTCDKGGYTWHRIHWDRRFKSPDDLILRLGKRAFAESLGLRLPALSLAQP